MKSLILFLCVVYIIPSANGQLLDEPIITKSIYFGGGSYYIDPQQAADLKELINSIKSLELYEVYVHGHTDNIGSIEYNQWLSDMRTDMVILKIKGNGIAPENIFEKDFGENSPVYDNNTWEGKLKNRRVDIIFKKLQL
jgi:outer membrane protein OmpA-like peptidoglycan-associated protein